MEIKDILSIKMLEGDFYIHVDGPNNDLLTGIGRTLKEMAAQSGMTTEFVIDIIRSEMLEP